MYAAKAPRLAGDTTRHNVNQTFPPAEILLVDVAFDKGPGIIQ
jgi:hypothetical protein